MTDMEDKARMHAPLHDPEAPGPCWTLQLIYPACCSEVERLTPQPSRPGPSWGHPCHCPLSTLYPLNQRPVLPLPLPPGSQSKSFQYCKSGTLAKRNYTMDRLKDYVPNPFRTCGLSPPGLSRPHGSSFTSPYSLNCSPHCTTFAHARPWT